MLSTGTAASVGIDTDVVIVDLYIQVFLDIRHNIAGYEGSLAFACCIERRNTDKTVYTFLGFEIAVSILSVDLEGNGFDTGFIAVEVIKHFHTESLAVYPAAVHTIKHSTPVTGFCSTCSGIELDDRIFAVIFS